MGKETISKLKKYIKNLLLIKKIIEIKIVNPNNLVKEYDGIKKKHENKTIILIKQRKVVHLEYKKIKVNLNS